jgi:hypothetical protein
MALLTDRLPVICPSNYIHRLYQIQKWLMAYRMNRAIYIIWHGNVNVWSYSGRLGLLFLPTYM